MTLTYRHFIGKCAIDALIVADCLLFLLLVEVVFSKSKEYKLDLYTRLVILIATIGCIVSLFRGNGIMIVLRTSWVYIRFIGLYHLVAYSKDSVSTRDIKSYMMLNIIITSLLTPLCIRGNQDDIAGFMGFSGVRAFTYLAIIFYSYSVYNYVCKLSNIKTFITQSGVYFIWCAVGENKIPLIYGICVVILAIFLLRTKRRQLNFRKVSIISIGAILGIASIKLLLKYHPEWGVIFSKGISNFVVSYTTEQQVGYIQMGRMSVYQYAYDNMLSSPDLKITGLGIGSAMPSEVANYHIFDYIMGIHNQNYKDYIYTNLYDQLGWSFGYHNSGLTILLLETGIIGVMAFLAIVLSFIIKSIVLLKSKDAIYKRAGFIGLSVFIYYILTFVYYDPIFQFNCQLVVVCVFAFVQRQYIALKNKETNYHLIEEQLK